MDRFCVYCTEYEYCDSEKFEKTKCKRFRGNLDYSFKIKVIRWIFWIKNQDLKNEGLIND